MKFQLRDYQIEALQSVAEAQGRGVSKMLGVAATGLGKTIMFSTLARDRGGRTLILAHRDELITQAAQKVKDIWPEAKIGRVQAQDDNVRAEVVVASVQTLSRPARLKRLMDAWRYPSLVPVEPFSTVVVDEAHHSAADSYRAIFDALGAGEPGGPLLFGVTATPDRGDGRGLDDLFDEVVFSYDILWGIRSGYLSDLRGLRCTIAAFDTKALKVTAGDYNQGVAGNLLEQAGAPRLIVDSWIENAKERPTLAFTPTVSMAEHLAAEFVGRGVVAACVSAGTPREDRRRILADFSEGKITVVTNCGVLTEGYDEPTVGCVIVARPTKSRALYVQMVGRGTRRHPLKNDCIVLDVVGASDEHSLCTIPSLFGLEKKFRKRAERGEAGISDLVEEQEQAMVASGRLRAEEVHLFAKVRSEGIAWVATHREGDPRKRYVRPLGRNRPTVVLGQTRDNDPNAWAAGLKIPGGKPKTFITNVTLEVAQGVGEDYIRTQPRGTGPAIATLGAAWRKRSPSPTQIKAAVKLRVQVDPKWNAGELSDALTARIAEFDHSRSGA